MRVFFAHANWTLDFCSDFLELKYIYVAIGLSRVTDEGSLPKIAQHTISL